MLGSFLLFFTESHFPPTPPFCLKELLRADAGWDFQRYLNTGFVCPNLPGIPLTLTKRERHLQKESLHPSYTSSPSWDGLSPVYGLLH